MNVGAGGVSDVSLEVLAPALELESSTASALLDDASLDAGPSAGSPVAVATDVSPASFLSGEQPITNDIDAAPTRDDPHQLRQPITLEDTTRSVGCGVRGRRREPEPVQPRVRAQVRRDAESRWWRIVSCATQRYKTLVAVDVLTEIVIDRPRAEVAAYASHPDHAPAWYVNIEAVEWQTPPPLVVGSRLAFVARFLGRRLAYTYEIVELVEGERLVQRTAEGPFPMETTYTWESLDERRTRMTLRNRGEPTGFSKLAAPFMAAAMRRANQNDLARLKALLERRD